MPMSANRMASAPLAERAALEPSDRQVLTEQDLAQRWALNPKTLQRWRAEGRGPSYQKVMKRVNYPLDAVLEYERRVLVAGISARVTR